MGVDVLGIGCSAVDDVLYVDRYPAADCKVEANRRERRCGGLTAVALMTAARMGASCQFAGVLGNDELSRFVLDSMADSGVDVSTAVMKPDARPVHSVIVVDESSGTRTIFYDTHNAYGADPELPPQAQIRSARVLLIDHYGTDGQIRASRIAREAGIPVVADLEDHSAPGFGELLHLVDHLILSQASAARITGHQDPCAAAKGLWHSGRSVVAITVGKQGCWYVDDRNHIVHLPAFNIEAVDTTGCGDVFHGAYAAGLARERPVFECLRLASAAAALKAKQATIPTARDVAQFLQKQSS